MMVLCPDMLTDEPEFYHPEIQILLDTDKKCTIFKDISTQVCTIRIVIPRAIRIIKPILISPLVSASNERFYNRLKLV